MTIPKQKTFDNKLIEPRNPELKKVKCPYCRKKYRVIDNRHLEHCQSYQKYLEKARNSQKSIFDFCEKIERKSYLIDLIFPNSWNVNSMSIENFEGLKESIRKTKGEYLKKNPIQIRELEKDKYEIIDGEHRWKACKEIGFAKIPAILENDMDIENSKVMNVIYSRNRGKIDYFKLSKLLNEEYKDENGKRKYTQQELANKYGFLKRRKISSILKIYERLTDSQIKKMRVNPHFENTHFENIAKCENALLRDKLIEFSIKKEWTADEIKKEAIKLNKISKFLNREFLKSTKKCVLDIFSGDFLFTHTHNEFVEKVWNLIVDNNRKDIIIKYVKDWVLHSNVAKQYKEEYIKKHKTYSNWYNTFRGTPEARAGSRMVWNFFCEYYNHHEILCWYCNKEIENFNHFSDHHEEYEFKDDFLFHVFVDGEQKIFPIHSDKKCHLKGTSENWNNH